MVDPVVYPPRPEDDGIVRRTEHSATLQSATTPRVSYEAETYQEPTPPQAPRTPSIDDYQDPGMPPQAQPTPNTTQVPPVAPGQTQDRFPGVQKPIPEETILEWTALSRPFKQRTRQYFSTVLIIGLLISMILFFAGQTLPIAVVVAVIFLIYVLNVIPPGMVRHAITNYGIRVENQMYFWDELGRFWYTDKHKQRVLHIEVARFPGRLTLLLGDVPEAEMTELLSEVLINQQPKPTLYEQWAKWLQDKIPLENE